MEDERYLSPGDEHAIAGSRNLARLEWFRQALARGCDRCRGTATHVRRVRGVVQSVLCQVCAIRARVEARSPEAIAERQKMRARINAARAWRPRGR
jgi:hypothetical protein